jgi:hypothetical protein
VEWWLPESGKRNEEGEMGKGLSMGTKLQLKRSKKIWVLLYSRVTVDNNNLLYISKS